MPEDAVLDGCSYKLSRFNLTAWDGVPYESDLLVYNSLTCAFVRVSQPDANGVFDRAPDRLSHDVAQTLIQQGLLVSDTFDELEFMDLLETEFHQRTDTLNLILMPTEKCNFRCVYCYEDFVKGKMSEDVRLAIVALVASQIQNLRRLSVDWFGGEPLSAMNVVEDISERLIAVCDSRGVEYTASMTTNGFLLTAPIAQRALNARIARYQITIDGVRETHNSLRVLRNGRGTFDTIVDNLLTMKSLPDSFKVRIRVNYTPQVVERMPEFLDFLGSRFGNDPRFSIWFHPVGRWGGPHDDEVEVCDAASSDDLERQFTVAAADAGFPFQSWRQSMEPFGSVCYAADPRSFVIGSDATVYKCTVALREPKNIVGRLTRGGELQLRDDHMAVWVNSGAGVDLGCQACAFRPACHGDACPLERLRTSQRACPPLKRGADKVLPIIARQSTARS